ncbi:MAG: hypothetical protein QOE70_3267 [Chthoniobacter sp.]|nr:hypothetical protein [Chthoniobacter sp.]
MNAKTWQTVCGFSVALFVAVAASFIFSPSQPLLRYLGAACLAILIVVGFTGAWFGLLLCLGRLHFGCPFCGTRSPVAGATKKHLYLECPSCGPVCVTSRPFRTATASRLSAETQ